MTRCVRCKGVGSLRYRPGSRMVIDCPNCRGRKRPPTPTLTSEEARWRNTLLAAALQKERMRQEAVVYVVMPAVGDGLGG